jgi:hypothetical protein
MSVHSIRVVILSREDGEEPVLSLSKESLAFSGALGTPKGSEMFRSAQHDSLGERAP